MSRELLIRNGEIVIYNNESRSAIHLEPDEALEILALLQTGRKDIKKAAKNELEREKEVYPTIAYRFYSNAGGNDYFYHANPNCRPKFLNDGRKYEKLHSHNIGPYVDQKCMACEHYLD